MDIVSASTAVGFLASIATQTIKREKAGSLENFLLALGASQGGVQIGSLLGIHGIDPVFTSFASYATHGVLADQRFMQALKFAGIDKVLEGIGKAVSTMSSRSNGV